MYIHRVTIAQPGASSTAVDYPKETTLWSLHEKF